MSGRDFEPWPKWWESATFYALLTLGAGAIVVATALYLIGRTA